MTLIDVYPLVFLSFSTAHTRDTKSPHNGINIMLIFTLIWSSLSAVHGAKTAHSDIEARGCP